jgi:hypothetical protein
MGGGGCPSRCRGGWAEEGERERAMFLEKVTKWWPAALLVVDGGRRHCFCELVEYQVI